jgi:hypothetical protein
MDVGPWPLVSYVAEVGVSMDATGGGMRGVVRASPHLTMSSQALT